MAGNPVIGVDVVAKLDSFRAELAKIPGVGAENAQAMAARMNKELRALTRAQQAANREMANAGKGAAAGLGSARGAASNLQAQLFDIGQQLQAGTNPLTILSQQGPQVAQALMGAGGGMAALKAALVSTAAVVGPVVVAVGAGYAAWRAYNEETDRAAAIAADVSVAHKAMQPILDDTRGKLVDLAEATGELSAVEADQVRNAIRGLGQWRAAMDETIQKSEDLRARQAGIWTQVVDKVEGFADAMGPLGVVGGTLFGGLTTSTAEYQEQIVALDAEVAKSIEVLGINVDVTDDLTAATDRAARSKKAAADAERDRQKAWRESLAIMDEDTRRVRDVESGVQSLADVRHAAAVEQMDDYQRVNAAAQQQLDAILATYQATVALADTDAQRLELLAEYSAARVEIQNAEAAQLAELRDKEAEAQRVAMERELSAARQLAAERVSFAAGAAANIEAIASEVAARGGEAAMVAAGAARAAALFQVGVDTAAAVVKGIALFGPPPSPAGIAAIGAAVAIGGAQTAVIASEPMPKYHKGGEVQAALLPGEFVMSRQGRSAVGDDALNRANAGMSGAAEPRVVVVHAYRHGRMVDRYERDRLSVGNPYARAIGAGRVLGHG